MASATFSLRLPAAGPLWAAALPIAALAFGALTLSPAARADDTAYGGDSRTLGMGGAGIALQPDVNGGEGRVNPASLAFERGGVSLSGPGLGFRANQVDVGKTAGYFLNGLSASSAADLGRSFATHDSDFGTNGNVGLRFGHLEISAGGVAIGRITPNTALSTWAQAGRTDYSTLPFDAAAHVYGAGIVNLPAVSYAFRIPQAKPGAFDLGMGVRLKYMEAVYSHYVADSDTIKGYFDATPAVEMGGKKSLTQQGVGMDFGLTLHPRGRSPFSAALVATNVLGPRFSFAGTDRDGHKVNFNLLATALTAGVGYQRKGTTFAADIADIGASANSTQLRLGAEQRLFRNVFLRSGYCSGTGFTAGVGIAGFSFAYGKHMPLQITRTLNF